MLKTVVLLNICGNYSSQHLKWIKTFHQSYTWVLNNTHSSLIWLTFLMHLNIWVYLG